jgi:3-hydroxybutyryl-CoA dehydrogenase
MIQKIIELAVCGAGGTMGAGIAIVAARAGYSTICHDVSQEALERCRQQADAFFSQSVKRGKMSSSDKEETLARMTMTTDLASVAKVDLVIEAVFESLDVKRTLLRQLNGVCSPETIFASNTSTLSITEIASGCGREDRVIGLHFCLPAQLMKLIEVSKGLNTSQQTLDLCWQWTVDAGQYPVETQDKPGFILNALLVPFNNDVIRAVEANVAAPAEIDRAIKLALGYKMGPCELIDLIGLDTQIRLCEAFYPITLDPRASTPPLLRRMVAAGHLGRKSGRGFYNYGA